MQQGNIRDYKLKLDGLLAESTRLLRENGRAQAATELQAKVAEKLASYKPSLMFYGIYNAGKSTLLNAIFGEARASVADKPETKTVSSYAWNSYQLVDTPGINGPEEDFLVTLPELEKHDLVLFVIDDSESFDDALVAREAVKIIQGKKPLITVINSKQGYDSDEQEQQRIAEIKQKFLSNMQKEADKHGIHAVDQRFDYARVNADSAFRAKQENKPALLAKSNIRDLESLILNKLKELDGPKVLIVPADMMLTELKQLLTELQSHLLEGDESELYAFIRELTERKAQLYKVIVAKIKREILEAGGTIYQLASNGQDTTQVQEELQRRLQAVIDEEIASTMSILNQDILSANLKLPSSFLQIQSLKQADETGEMMTMPDMPTSDSSSVGDMGLNPMVTSVLVSGIAKWLPRALPFVSKLPPLVVPVLIFEGLRFIFSLVNSKQQEEKRREQMENHVREFNSQQQQAMNDRIAALQELQTQIRLKLFQMEETVIESVEQHIDQLFQTMIDTITRELETVLQTRAFNKDHLNQTNVLLADIEKFKLSLI